MRGSVHPALARDGHGSQRVRMELVARPYAGEDDFWRVRAFLRHLRLEAGFHPRAWDVLRWDYWRWHIVPNCGAPPPEEAVTLYETAVGDLRAVLNQDGPGECFFQVDPRDDTDELRARMLARAEERLRTAAGLLVWTVGSDDRWSRLMQRSGYRRAADDEHVRLACLDRPIDAPALTPGYRIRSLAEGDADFPARGDISLRVFHPVPDGSTAMTADEYRNIQRAPLYRRDLDLVVEAADGGLAAFATLWFDDTLRTVDIEPMGTDAPHRQRGLGKAILLEGMRRAQRMGATRAYVSSYGPAAHALYASVGLVTVEHMLGWRRDGPAG